MTSSPAASRLDWIRDLLERNSIRVFLSVLILVSVSPVKLPAWAALLFFALFALELSGRIAVFRAEVATEGLRLGEILFLFLDAVATLSFLPLHGLWADARLLRLLRLSRLLLVLSYWGPYVRDLGTVLRKQERRAQLLFAGFAVLLLSFLSAVLLHHFASHSIDFNGDGRVGDDGFADMLWWSFRMVQDPGNLISAPSASLAFVCSTVLTVSGLFVFSFIVGLATSVVDELVTLGRERRLGLKRHTVLCNLSEYAEPLLRELVSYYRKSGRSARLATLGPTPSRYPYMYRHPLSKIRYRQGQPLSRHDLQKVDVDRAKRVILMGQRGRGESDAEVVSQILSVREFNPEADIYAEIFRPGSVPAALEAGGPRTIPLLSDLLVGQLLAKLVAFPGMEQLFEELLTSRGNEVYTAVYDQTVLAGLSPPEASLPSYAELVRLARQRHGVLLLGPLVASEHARRGYLPLLVPGPEHSDPAGTVRGLVGVAENFSAMRRLAETLCSSERVSVEGDGDFSSAGEAASGDAAIPSFVLCPEVRQMRRLLVCGFHPGVVPFAEHILLLSSTPELFLMVPDALWRALVRQQLLAHAPEPLPGELSVRFVPEDGEAHLRYEVLRDGAVLRSGAVRLLVGDWTQGPTLLNLTDLPGGLSAVDAVLFTYLSAPGSPHLSAPADADANTSLALLTLQQLEARGEFAHRSGSLRVVCELRSQEKAALIADRFGHRSRPEGMGCHPVSVLSAERMRHDLIAQAVFVPGLDLVYRELLGEAGREIVRLVPEHPACAARLTEEEQDGADGEVTFDDLLHTLLVRESVLLLAAEIDQDGERQIVVNPPPGTPRARFRWSEIQAVFVVGELNRQRPACRRCASCTVLPSGGRPGGGSGDPGGGRGRCASP